MSTTVAPTWVLTDHAITRYIERVEPRATYERAIAALMRECSLATKRKDCGEYELWRSGRTGRRLRLRVRRDGERLELVTVLFAFDREPRGAAGE